MVASNYLKEELIDEGFEAEKIKINPLYTFSPDNIQTLSSDHNKILFVGQLVTGKGLDILIEAMHLVNPSIKLDICGTGAQEQQYRDLVKQYHLESRVSFSGFVQERDLKLKYQEALAVCIPSRAPETFCLTGLEALKYKTPVIASDVGGMSQWMKHNHNSLSFTSGNIKELAQDIDTLYAHLDLAKRLGEQGYDDVNAHYLPYHHINTLLRIFSDHGEDLS